MKTSRLIQTLLYLTLLQYFSRATTEITWSLSFTDSPTQGVQYVTQSDKSSFENTLFVDEKIIRSESGHLQNLLGKRTSENINYISSDPVIRNYTRLICVIQSSRTLRFLGIRTKIFNNELLQPLPSTTRTPAVVDLVTCVAFCPDFSCTLTFVPFFL